MGKHTAGDDSAVHPLVADALARRSGSSGPAHGKDAAARSGSTGWPEPQPEGGGSLGWPDDTRADQGSEPQEAADPAGAPDGPQPRGGWRRLFGASSAA